MTLPTGTVHLTDPERPQVRLMTEQTTNATPPPGDAEASDTLALVARVLDQIDVAQGPVSLSDLADAAGYSSDHLARVFRQHVGVTPARYQAHLRAETGRRLLRDRSVLDATIALGESSPARVHDLLVTVEAVTPGEARRGGEGVTIRHGVHPSTLGPMLVATTERGVVQVAFTRDVPGTDFTDPAAHGSGFERTRAFADGYEGGPASCYPAPQQDWVVGS